MNLWAQHLQSNLRNTHERVTIYLNYSDAVVVADGIAINPLSYVYQKECFNRCLID